MIDYAADVAKYTSNLNGAVVDGIVKHCGIALRSKDSSLVSCSQKPELDRVRKNFLRKKLRLMDETDEALDAAIQDVCRKMGSSNTTKSRVTFYYLLAEKFGKQSLFG
jgi:uncharacterized protein DUF2853